MNETAVSTLMGPKTMIVLFVFMKTFVDFEAISIQLPLPPIRTRSPLSRNPLGVL